MKIRNYILSILLLVTLAKPASLHALAYPEARTNGLINIGLILAAGGTYQLIKRSESHSLRLVDICSGLTLLTASILTVLLSSQFLTEIDQCFK
jgi:hypothetical protein